jgi:hypothetical protein
MPREIDFDAFEEEVGAHFTPPQREWIARLLHDHVSGLVTTLAMQVEIINKMVSRNMDISEELASMKVNVSAAAQHIVEIEKRIKPKTE